MAALRKTILRFFDIPQGILLSVGFNVLIAEVGTRYSEKDLRFKCIRALTEHVTTMTESQSGTGSEDLRNFPSWDIPLAFGDSRTPDEIDLWADELPSWAAEEEVEEEEEGEEGTAPPEGPQDQVPPQQGHSQPKRMPRSIGDVQSLLKIELYVLASD